MTYEVYNDYSSHLTVTQTSVSYNQRSYQSLLESLENFGKSFSNRSTTEHLIKILTFEFIRERTVMLW